VKKNSWNKPSYAILVRFNNIYEASVAVFFLNGLELFKEKISAKILKEKNLQTDPEPRKLCNPGCPVIKIKQYPKALPSIINYLRSFGSCSIETRVNSNLETKQSLDLVYFYNLKIGKYCSQAIDGEFVYFKKINAYYEKKYNPSNFENTKETFETEKLVEYSLEKIKNSWGKFCFGFFKLPSQSKLKKGHMIEIFEALVDFFVFKSQDKMSDPVDLCLFFSLTKVCFNFVFQHGFFFTEWNGVRFKKQVLVDKRNFFN